MGRSIHRSRVGCAASQKDAVVLPFIFLAEAAAACRRWSVRRRRVNMRWVAEAVRQTRSGATAMGPVAEPKILILGSPNNYMCTISYALYKSLLNY